VRERREKKRKKREKENDRGGGGGGGGVGGRLLHVVYGRREEIRGNKGFDAKITKASLPTNHLKFSS
jgi:hypothetical protein